MISWDTRKTSYVIEVQFDDIFSFLSFRTLFTLFIQ